MITAVFLVLIASSAPLPAMAEDETAIEAPAAEEAPAVEGPAVEAPAEEQANPAEGGAPAEAAPGDEQGDTGGDLDLLGGDEIVEEETDIPDKPKPKPKPKPVPKPKPRPKPAPPPPPPAPFEFLAIEDFEAWPAGPASQGLRRAGADPRPQFAANVVSPGQGGAKALQLAQVPPRSDTTAWSLPKTVDLKAWRGVSLWVKASAPVEEFKVGVAGGQGYIYKTVPVTPQWSEVRLDFAEDPGRGKFDAATVKEIVVTAAHGNQQSVDVFVDTIAAWRERVPSAALRWGLNATARPGPLDWRARWETVNCTALVSPAPPMLALSFWSPQAPYSHWSSISIWRDLPHDLLGALSLAVTVRVDPPRPEAWLKFSMKEEDGTVFYVFRPAPGEFTTVRVPFAEFIQELPPGAPEPVPGQVRVLNPQSVREWSMEVIPATERTCRGTVFIKEAWAMGAEPAPAPKPAAPKPVAKPAALKKPVPAPKPVAEPEPATEPAPEVQPEEVPAPAEGGGDGELELQE